MKLVIIESPLRGDREKHKFYARLCMLDCLRRGEAPFALHVLYDHPDVLDDTKPDQRTLGMQAGFAWGAKADLCAVYEDINIWEGTLYSSGMIDGIERAKKAGIQVVVRHLPNDIANVFLTRYPL